MVYAEVIRRRPGIGLMPRFRTINKTTNMKPQTLPATALLNGSCATDFSLAPVTARLRRILVADDNECVRLGATALLARAGFGVDAAADGLEAWEALQQEHYDLLVTDHEMLRLTGLKLIERIRDAGMSLPIIMASGSCRTEEVRAFAQLQIAAFIPKPFEIREFLTVVRMALQESDKPTVTSHRAFRPLNANPQPIRSCNQSNPEL